MVKASESYVVIDTFVEEEGHELDVNDVMADHGATLGQLFTVCRQWTPKVQSKIGDIVNEFLCRGASPNDRDALTGDTLLHFTCKAGAVGLGCEREAAMAVKRLLDSGASPNAQSKWTGLTPVHTAAMFGFEQGLKLMLDGARRVQCNAKASSYDAQTPLHLAVQGRHMGCIALLLNHGASRTQQDDAGKTPYDYALEAQRNAKGQAERDDVASVCRLLREQPDTASSSSSAAAASSSSSRASATTSGSVRRGSRGSVAARASVATIEVGDRVTISGQRVGTVLYRGLVDFKPGRWLGIELDSPQGKHDGTVQGKTYFTCPDGHGVFVLADTASLLTKGPKNTTSAATTSSKGGKRATHATTTAGTTKPTTSATATAGASSSSSTASHVPSTPRRQQRGAGSTGASPSSRIPSRSPKGAGKSPRGRVSSGSGKVGVGSRVTVNGKRGHIRFIGDTEFADGMWLGVELSEPAGKNDGTVQGKRYFTAKHDHGLFVRPTRATVHGVTVDKLLA
ncbi:hypothetical protein PTSG_06843 [Salpingoeca rosetta]|uniref:CAP-Gly domain-containing protein n=1 Tax=Salpingoeca rosetta (strain ATCC 50818 / BSB-021) TaxID=946362 RepID=F2UEZ0_SALR5|nr:uncharacterized protein PTSG_06843 [Salpingoeca rosetta]EGD75190.1 hypothetical protein PTSG_06843 [Salpingoeca rosetta]|eukprot:XP_004992243.1 hypothetical protein PTSG_06843 [Salpingoeca rosetta]